MNTRVLIEEIISWVYDRPFSILIDGGYSPDERIRDAIDTELKVFLDKLRNKDYNIVDLNLMYDMFHKDNYRADFPCYSSSNNNLRREFRPLHDEICFYLYDSNDGGRRNCKKIRKRIKLISPKFALNTS